MLPSAVVSVLFQRINMLSSVFRRWDEQYTVIPNQLLAKREIRNQRRSGNAVMVMTIEVSMSTGQVRDNGHVPVTRFMSSFTNC